MWAKRKDTQPLQPLQPLKKATQAPATAEVSIQAADIWGLALSWEIKASALLASSRKLLYINGTNEAAKIGLDFVMLTSLIGCRQLGGSMHPKLAS